MITNFIALTVITFVLAVVGYIAGLILGFFTGDAYHGAELGKKIGIGVGIVLICMYATINIVKTRKDAAKKRAREALEKSNWKCPVCNKIVSTGVGRCTATPNCNGWKCPRCLHINSKIGGCGGCAAYELYSNGEVAESVFMRYIHNWAKKRIESNK